MVLQAMPEASASVSGGAFFVMFLSNLRMGTTNVTSIRAFFEIYWVMNGY